MALELVTVDQCKMHLRIDDDEQDDWLAIWIAAASEAVRSWLKDDWRLYLPARDSSNDVIEDSAGDPIPALDVNGDEVVHPTVRGAVLIEIAWQMRFREGEGEHTATGDLYSGRYGYTLSRGATALLNGLRKTTVA